MNNSFNYINKVQRQHCVLVFTKRLQFEAIAKKKTQIKEVSSFKPILLQRNLGNTNVLGSVL